MKRASMLLALTLVACEKQEPVSHVPREEAVNIAREAAQAAFQQLSAELAKTIEDGGTEAAIPVCSTKAQTLVSDVAATRKLTMIRLSDRPRNPKQAAGVEDLAAMENFRAAMKQGEAPSPAVQEMADGSTVVRLPIILSQPLCLQCHGSADEIAPQTRSAILATYPEDKATGYQINDLRGIWRIDVSTP
ncbi:MAG: DUF3365 domain-containing protein [Verrucomicrobiaceae bacterium]|nr:MAG: DUF3365 domain-containing protein [Verrucomicrobiaceae bacterium]